MVERSPRLVYLLLGTACVFIIMFGIRGTAVILNPILLAMVITITVLPLPSILRARGLPGWLALVLTVLAVVGALAFTVLVFVVGLSRLALSLPTYANNIATRTTELSTWLESTFPQATTSITTIDPTQVSNGIASFLGGVANTLAQVGITILIFIFMVSAAVSASSSSRAEVDVVMPMMSRVSSFTADVRKYVTVTTIINLLVGLADTVMLLILGVDFAFLWGVLSWVMGYIPVVGFWLALIPPTILAWAEFGVPTAVIVLVGYVLINGSVQNLIQPKMMGDQLRISPVVVFIALFVWSWLLGGIGAILAVPLTLIILSVLDSLEGTRWLTALLRPSHQHDPDEQRKAREQVNNLWERTRGFVRFQQNNSAEKEEKQQTE